MTTNENDVAIEPIVEVDDSPRSLDILLMLPTYQGMTDEEIALVIEYKCGQAVTKALNDSLAKNNEDMRKANDAVLDLMIERMQESDKMLRDNLADRQYHQLQPLIVSATTLELEVGENG